MSHFYFCLPWLESCIPVIFICSGSFQPDQEKACNICPFQGFNISQKPKSSPLLYFAQKRILSWRQIDIQ